MEIRINKIATGLKLKTPDLITRPVGKELFSKVSTIVENIHDGEVLLIDFSGYRVLDPSFIDEFIIRLIFKSRENEPSFHVKLTSISDIAVMNISSVFKSYNNARNVRLSVITDNVINNSYYIGDLSSLERDIINYLVVNKSALPLEIASFLEISPEETVHILDDMHRMRILRKIVHDSAPYYYSL